MRRAGAGRAFLALLALAALGVPLFGSCSSDNKDQARDCCACIYDHDCWDTAKCSSNKDCVCTLLGTQCSSSPCMAVIEECRTKWCNECDSLFK